MATKTKADTQAAIEMLVQKMQSVPIDSLTKYPKNPRVGNLQAIKESIKENGFFRPLIVQKSTNYVVGGNHSWQAARELGMTRVPVVYLDVDDKRAAKIVLSDNRTNDLATYDTDILAEVMKSIDNPVGTGYSPEDYSALVDAIEFHEHDKIEDVIRPSLTIQRPTEDGAAPTAVIKNPVVAPPTAQEREEQGRQTEEEDDDEMLNGVDANLQGILQLSEGQEFPSNNYYGIPDLAGGVSLLDKLPAGLDTWAGIEATPDDGKAWWLWNYGVAPRKGLPADRAILCFYTYDTYFEGWWEQPAFYTAKVLNMGIKYVVVPDFSFYTDTPTALHIYNTYRAQWMGRYFQEAGLKLIPRLQFSVGDGGKSMDFCMAGIPVNPPVLAQSVQNTNNREENKASIDNTIKALQTLQPTQWLVYGGNPAVRQIEAIDPVAKGLCDEVVHVYNYAHKRRGVVFDKKEGLAGAQARKKEKKKRERDPFAGEDVNNDIEAAKPTPKSEARKRANKGQPVPEHDDEFDPEDID